MFTFQIVRNKSTLCTAKRFRRAATGCSLGKYPRQHLTTLSLLMDGGGGGIVVRCTTKQDAATPKRSSRYSDKALTTRCSVPAGCAGRLI
ncbi:MAG: hypothetical protein ACK5JP_07965 [Akkermansiaceae bacterium]